jgi:hypothetical protein
MIVAQAQKVRDQLVTLKNLEEDEKNRKDIEATYNAVQQVTAILTQFATLYALVCPRLETQQKLYIIGQVRQISQAITTSQHDFAQQRRQVKSLQNIRQQQIEPLKQQTEENWKLYAENQLRPQFELLTLVRQLPEVTSQQSEFDILKDRLKQFVDKPPRSKTELAEFDQKLQKLTKQLSGLKLEPVIRGFLNSVLQGEATLADVSDEVLTWCRQGKRAKTFKVTFR